ncbi:chemotaxis protein CheW [Deinococcus oregonensis]|uniref:Chemotaxis protein CheW n=1 Tax=Deinococcus oregonensis TaxID=1805970 RepID=A0ABV6B056_9DEIO
MTGSLKTSQRALVVMLRGHTFAVDVSYVRGVVPVAEIASLPGAGTGLHGLIAARGTVLPLVNLAALLELPPGSAPAQAVLLESGTDLFALAVNEVLEFANLPVETPQPLSLLTPAHLGGREAQLIHPPALLAALLDPTLPPTVLRPSA